MLIFKILKKMNTNCKMSLLFSLLQNCEITNFVVIGDDVILRKKEDVTDFLREGLHELFLKGKVEGERFIISC